MITGAMLSLFNIVYNENKVNKFMTAIKRYIIAFFFEQFIHFENVHLIFVFCVNKLSRNLALYFIVPIHSIWSCFMKMKNQKEKTNLRDFFFFFEES